MSGGDGRREFRALWVTEIVSTVGDQLAKVAVSVVVFQRTGSATAAALTYALTLIPTIVAGPLLSPMADRFRHRELMVGCAWIQTGLVVVMAATALVPSDTIAVLGMGIAITGVSTITAPFRAARDATVPELVGAERVGRAQRLMTSVREIGQLAGLAGSAGVVAVVGPGTALLLDAVSFAVTAIVLRTVLRLRPAFAHDASATPGRRRDAVRELTRPGPLALVGMALLVAPTIVPDALVVPLVQQMGAPTQMVGILLAADCAGLVVADLVQRVLQRSWPNLDQAAIVPLLLLSLAPLGAFVLHPGLPIAVLLLFLSGAGATYLPLVKGALTPLLPPAVRGTGLGMVRTLVTAGQGLGALAGGAVTDGVGSASAVVGWPALVSLVPAGLLAWAWARARRAVPAAQG